MPDEKSNDLSRYIEPMTHYMEADEPVNLAYRRMDANALRTLLVIKDGRVLGLVDWQDIRDLSGSHDPIEEHARVECPVIRESMTIDEALAIFDNSDVALDRFPVVDDSGQLIGEIARENFQARLHNVPDGNGEQDVLAEDLRQARGATVIDASGEKLGTLNGVRTEGDRVTGILVKHGRLRRKYKPVPIDEFDRHEGDNIYLLIDKAEFKILRDL